MELLSTFPPLLSACGQPAYTNYVGGFHGCLDYIFIQPESMQVTTLTLIQLRDGITYGRSVCMDVLRDARMHRGVTPNCSKESDVIAVIYANYMTTNNQIA